MEQHVVAVSYIAAGDIANISKHVSVTPTPGSVIVNGPRSRSRHSWTKVGSLRPLDGITSCWSFASRPVGQDRVGSEKVGPEQRCAVEADCCRRPEVAWLGGRSECRTVRGGVPLVVVSLYALDETISASSAIERMMTIC